MSIRLLVFFALAASATLLTSFGCTPADTDPHAKIDAPGYYNGTMQPHGGQAGAKKAPSPDAKGD